MRAFAMSSPSPNLLVIEPNEAEFQIIEEVIESLCPEARVLRCPTPDDALGLLFNANEEGLGIHEQPVSFILLDIDGPGMFGLTFLQKIKADERTMMVPVVILTGVAIPVIIQRTYSLGGAGFIIKQMDDPEQFRETIRSMLDYWLNVVSLPPRGDVKFN